ncbi:MAG: hypothetical protein ACAI35_02810, partial [Candidatus Methylacidiphilales bacterium]
IRVAMRISFLTQRPQRRDDRYVEKGMRKENERERADRKEILASLPGRILALLCHWTGARHCL